MPLINKTKAFIKKPFYAKYNFLNHCFYRIKTAVWYRFFFGSIGSGCTLRRPILLNNPQFIYMGNGVHIRDGARIEVIVVSSSLRNPELSIGNNVNIEQNVHIICQSRISIGHNVSITGNCAIVDVIHPYKDIYDPTKIGDRFSDKESFVEIGEDSFLGFGALIMPNVRIGKYCIIGAHAVVTQDVPDYTVVAGIPARAIRHYDLSLNAWVSDDHTCCSA